MENIKFNVMDQDDIMVEEQSTPNILRQIPIQDTQSIQPLQSQPIINEEDIIRNYIALNKPKICILTPCFASLCYVNYVNCLLNTMEVFRMYNIPVLSLIHI